MMPEIYLPPVIQKALDQGAALIISISGGKDSQAMLMALVIAYIRNGWTGPIYALHCDLGRAEWPESYSHCQRIAAIAGVRLVIVRRPQGDLIQEMEDRLEKVAGTGDPFWPSSSSRYCTSDQKRGQADKELRQPKPFWPSSEARYCTAHQKTNQANKELRNYPLVISAEGIRAGESTNRAKKQPVSIRKDVTAKALEALSPEDALTYRSLKQRLVLTWYPIFYWSDEEVYQRCGHTIEERNQRRELYRQGRKEEALDGWGMHPAYVYGNDRVSCVLCILGSLNDLRTGARHHPELLDYYINLEEKGQATFKNGWSLKELLVNQEEP
jgi:3'-phosphoadenosine 5'-phosphosulfate sulfotransferase (PAPS reductase)/FAD synthetase